MSSNMHSRLLWLIPFLLSGAMAFGAILGLSSDPEAAQVYGDNAGAAGALVSGICLGMGFTMATITIIVVKLLHRDTPDRIFLRFGFSVIGGSIIGVLVWNLSTVNTAIFWIIVIGCPILITWFSAAGRRV
ncbi:MAG: hypothetical protein GY699_03770 [Desulfobacteraceae bacterium]|nr:hypothetical protein [Desulfobacteraceae bacterium]